MSRKELWNRWMDGEVEEKPGQNCGSVSRRNSTTTPFSAVSAGVVRGGIMGGALGSRRAIVDDWRLSFALVCGAVRVESVVLGVDFAFVLCVVICLGVFGSVAVSLWWGWLLSWVDSSWGAVVLVPPLRNMVVPSK
jgi:hypothetical protein